MSAPLTLTSVKGGITRLRTKGAALKDSLYDLLNGYVTAQKTVVQRPGTDRAAVVPAADTKGLVAFDGTRHVFGAEEVSLPDGYTLHILAHPEGPDLSGNPIPIKAIHFAQPIMGALYVCAEFEHVTGFVPTQGYTFHYWIQQGEVWLANTIYQIGDIVAPSSPNGLMYQATRLTAPNPAWTPNVARAVGDIVEPTVYNGFYYQVVETEGDNPVSGGTEPVWIAQEGARVYEDSLGAYDGIVNAADQPNPDFTVQQSAGDRYQTPRTVK